MKKIKKQELHEIFQTLKKNKNEYIFGKLYDKYGDLVYRIAFSLIKQRENSEDIKQAVFLKIWEMENKDFPIKNEASWLYTVTKNETLNYIRKQEEAFDIDRLYFISNEDKNLNEIIEKDSYNKIISKLTPKEQEVVSLKILAGLSFKEISLILNESMGTVEWKYYKSLHTLKLLLGNLSLFIISITAYVIEKTKKDTSRNESSQEEAKDEIQEEGENNRIEESLDKKDEIQNR